MKATNSHAINRLMNNITYQKFVFALFVSTLVLTSLILGCNPAPLVGSAVVSETPITNMLINTPTVLTTAITPSAAAPQPTVINTTTPTITPIFTLTSNLSDTPAANLGKDGMYLILVPAGEFEMGSLEGDQDERPIHSVFLDAFLIDQTEVTNAMYVEFLKSISSEVTIESSFVKYNGNPILGLRCNDCDNWIDRIVWDGSIFTLTGDYENHPVVLVTWYGADAYCAWAGRTLPTEAQWEKAARGTQKFIYPWGDHPIDCSLANYEDCAGGTTQVGNYPEAASPYGVFDMAGNVWEWVADWHSYNYYARSPSVNPPGPESSENRVRVRRGGSWAGDAFVARTSNRGDDKVPEFANDNTGFRCASTQ